MRPHRTVIRRPAPGSFARRTTSAEDHFVVAHTGVPRIDADAWSVAVDGAVERPGRLRLEELRSLPAVSVTAVLECFGNPTLPARPIRSVGCATWRGVPLREVLDRCAARRDAGYVWLEAPDHGTYARTALDRFVKFVPLPRALEEDVLLAYEMNGEPLTPEHGAPVRAVVPGFYGTSWVKWLSRIHVSSERPVSPLTDWYVRRDTDGQPTAEPVWSVDVNSLVVRPDGATELPVGAHAVEGWAWGAREVVRVDVSTDGGRTWHRAGVEPRRSRAWQRFRYAWRADAPGPHVVMSQAVDAAGRTQPVDRVDINKVHAVTVTVRSEGATR